MAHFLVIFFFSTHRQKQKMSSTQIFARRILREHGVQLELESTFDYFLEFPHPRSQDASR